MSKIGTWSTTAGNNNATPPDGWPEGQAPSTVNDCAREMMASIRTAFNTLEYIDLGNTPSFLTATTFSMASADVVNFEVGRRVKLFDATTLYGTIISVSSTFVAVQLDSGALTSSLSSVAMAVVRETNNSLPKSVWRNRNILLNGQMDIWQRSASFQCANGAQTYTADRWGYLQSAAAAINISRSERSATTSNVPSLAQSGNFFNNALRLSVSAADAAIGAGEFSLLQYKVEGYDWRQIAHRPMHLSFWANSNKSGIYAVALRNGTGALSFVQNYTISATSSWQHFSITVPEAPATGTWDYSTGIGLLVGFTFAAGTTYQGGAGNWTATNILATSSQVNFLSSAGNTFAITGVTLREGNALLPLEIRPYQQELEGCRRYYQRITGDFIGFAIGTSSGVFRANFEPMRSTPSVDYPAVANLTVLAPGVGFVSVSAVATTTLGNNALFFSANVTNTPLTTGFGAYLRISSGAAIVLDAEL